MVDIAKLRQLVKSATSPRQQKMYQTLLDKALVEQQQPQQELKAIPKTLDKTQVAVVERIDSSLNHTEQKRSKGDVLSAVKEQQPTTGSKHNKKAQSSAKNKQKQKPDKQVQHCSDSNKSKTSVSKFQAIGTIFGELKFDAEDKLYISIDGINYPIIRAYCFWQSYWDRFLGLVKEKPGKYCLRVYPRGDNNSPGGYKFLLVQPLSKNNGSYADLNIPSFILSGVWQYSKLINSTVIAVYRNFDMLEELKKLKHNFQKVVFCRTNFLPVVWSNPPVEPYSWQSDLPSSEQMPCYFVRVKATLVGGQLVVQELLDEPTLEIPKSLRFQVKK